MKKVLLAVLLLTVGCFAQVNRIDVNTQTAFHGATDTGAANAYVVAIHPATAYYSGMPVIFFPANNNTTASTINVNSLGAKTIKKQSSTGLVDVASGDLQASTFVVLIYDGTYFELIGPFGNVTSGSGAFSGVNAQTVSYLALTGDNAKLITMNGTSLTLTLPAAPPSATWAILVENVNATDLTISRNSLNIDGAASNLTLHQNQGVIVFTDGSNYFTSRGKPTLTASDIPNITESQVTSLVSDLALKAPLASPALTGTPTAPTAAGGTNTTQVATTAFVTTASSTKAGTGSCGSHNFEIADTTSGPTCAQPAIVDLQNIVADAVVQNSSGSSAAPVATAIPNCANDGLHALIYSTTSHTWACQAISGSGGLCPTCMLGPDSSVIGGIVGAFPNSVFPSPSATLPLNPFAAGFTANSGVVMPFSAGFRNMYLRTSSAMTTGSSSMDFQRVATGSTPDSNNRSGFGGITMYPTAAAGVYSSTWPLSVWPVQKGDVWDVVSFSVGSSFATVRGMSWEIVGSTSQLLGTHLLGGQVALSTTAYTGPSQSTSVAITTEALQGVVIPYGATAKSLCIRYPSAQSGTGSYVITLRKNGTTSTALTTTLAASAAIGTSCDFTNTVSLAAGDWIDFQLQNNATASAAPIIGITMELAAPTAPATGMIVFGTGNQTIGSGTARYAAPFTTLIGTTEANSKAPLPRAVTMKNLACIYTTPPGTNPVVATIFKNGSASALTVSIPTSGAGTQIQTDSTHTVSFNASDDVSLEFNQSSGTNPAISSCSVEVD